MRGQLWAFAVTALVVQAAPPKAIVVIVGDDVGWNDVSYNRNVTGNGTRVESYTPNIDALARAGIRLDQHHVYPMCSPSRCSLLTGRLPVHVQLQQPFPETPSAGIPRNMTSLAQKLKQAGYQTHVVGKWDVGMATPTHTPAGRGFDTGLIYWEHMNEYWTQGIFGGGTACTLVTPNITDLWDSLEGGPANSLAGTAYIELLFRDRIAAIIANYSTAQQKQQPAAALMGSVPATSSGVDGGRRGSEGADSEGAGEGAGSEGAGCEGAGEGAGSEGAGSEGAVGGLFLYYAPHLVHYPLQVPQEYYDRYAWMGDDEPLCNSSTPYIWPGSGPRDFACRRQKSAMASMLDENVGALVAGLQAVPGLWDQTLLLFTSDNGSPLDLSEAGGSNAPMRGGKYATWGGGVRVPTFVSGGYIPAPLRGGARAGLAHIADWWATLAGLVNVSAEDPVAAAAGLPPPDAVDLWPMLSGANVTSPRAEIAMAAESLVSWPYKLQLGLQEFSGWTGALYPNASSTDAGITAIIDCGDGSGPASPGCLFDIEADPTEHEDLAAAQPGRVAAMVARLAELAPGFYSNNDTGVDVCPPGTLLCACWAAEHVWGGFFGPYQH